MKRIRLGWSKDRAVIPTAPLLEMDDLLFEGQKIVPSLQ